MCALSVVAAWPEPAYHVQDSNSYRPDGGSSALMVKVIAVTRVEMMGPKEEAKYLLDWVGRCLGYLSLTRSFNISRNMNENES